MLASIGAVLSGAPAGSAQGPARESVRRHSRLVGRCEGTFWRATSRAEVRRVVLAARRFDLAGRQRGRRNGPLGHVALEVLDLLANLVRYRTGRLDPSLDFLAGTLRRSRDAVWRALRALRAHGFLDWLRRYVPTGAERGPQVRQTTNAYRLSLPPQALTLLGRLGRTPSLPDDVAQAREDRAAELEVHRAGLPLDQLVRFEVQDDRLGGVLAAMARAVQERESARQSESKSKETP